MAQKNKCTHMLRRITNSHQWSNDLPYKSYSACCKLCGYRWTIYVDLNKGKEIPEPQVPSRKTRLTEKEVKSILLDRRSYGQIAKDYDVSHQSISAIKRGETYKYFCKNIPRYKPKIKLNITCQTCDQWCNNKCALGVPEAGVSFANECSFYNLK